METILIASVMVNCYLIIVLIARMRGKPRPAKDGSLATAHDEAFKRVILSISRNEPSIALGQMPVEQGEAAKAGARLAYATAEDIANQILAKAGHIDRCSWSVTFSENPKE